MEDTKKDAKETIAVDADMTSYFGESMTQADMYNMLLLHSVIQRRSMLDRSSIQARNSS